MSAIHVWLCTNSASAFELHHRYNSIPKWRDTLTCAAKHKNHSMEPSCRAKGKNWERAKKNCTHAAELLTLFITLRKKIDLVDCLLQGIKIWCVTVALLYCGATKLLFVASRISCTGASLWVLLIPCGKKKKVCESQVWFKVSQETSSNFFTWARPFSAIIKFGL